MKSASTTPPRSAIHGISARDATSLIELDPPSKSTSRPPDSMPIAVPSPMANMVHEKLPRSAGSGIRLVASRVPTPAAMHAITSHPDRRSTRVGPVMAATTAAHSTVPASQ